jgi:uncharacterized cupredoxin-like copper-binding protein
VTLRRLIALAMVAVMAFGGGSAVARAHRHHRRAHHHRHHRARAKPAAPAATPKPLLLSHLQVPEREFSLSLSHPVLPAGPAGIEAVNFGEDAHDLRIERVGASASDPAIAFPILQPGKRASQTVNLLPGTYRLYCALAGHDALGMHATLVVR